MDTFILSDIFYTVFCIYIITLFLIFFLFYFNVIILFYFIN